jgi:hypothetical protein
MRLLLVAVVLAACSGDKPTEIDANPAGPKCSMQLYDLCVEEHDCMTGMCQNFAAQGLQVCTEGCAEPANPCPNDSSGTKGTCDQGLCRPAAANMCHL